ncbi:hypothetical protein DFH09DRAFT_1287850 [Mycena vulgaris]|nr:hypothetical protein DFH09DRAFT_1287850 [Mycena vulgaris]
MAEDLLWAPWPRPLDICVGVLGEKSAGGQWHGLVHEELLAVHGAAIEKVGHKCLLESGDTVNWGRNSTAGVRNGGSHPGCAAEKMGELGLGDHQDGGLHKRVARPPVTPFGQPFDHVVNNVQTKATHLTHSFRASLGVASHYFLPALPNQLGAGESKLTGNKPLPNPQTVFDGISGIERPQLGNPWVAEGRIASIIGRFASAAHTLRAPNAPSSIFLPSLQEIVAIESYNSMGGTGVSFAALHHPSTRVGIIVDDRGAVAEVPEERWSEFLAWVAEAKENLKESCPTDTCYDLGPAATKGAFVKFQLFGHEVYGDEPDAILQYVNGGRQIVSEIPPALVKVESAILVMMDDLLPKRDYSRPREPISKGVEELLKAVDSMAMMSSADFF